jgi:predicted RNA-binding protein (virulence factor B family)
MIYANQVFQELNIGDATNAYVNAIREDGRIDVILQKPGFESIDDSTKDLIDALEKNNGFLPLTDKSSPEAIYSALSMSKKSFKKAAGGLYKSRIIEINPDGIKLI